MTATSLEKELMELEKEFWEAMKARDARTVARLTDDRCIVIGAQGIGEIDKNTIAGVVEAAPYKLDAYSLESSDLHIMPLGNDIAMLAYKVNERVEVDGTTVEVDAYDSSVWVRRDGNWACAVHTESLAGDPFGRDKRWEIV